MEESIREVGRERVGRLVEAYKANRPDCLRENYNETQVRNDFVNPLLEALGWDVFNIKSAPQRLREVIVEESLAIDEANEGKKKPDYTLRLGERRKFFVEAKKPSVPIDRDPRPAFQTRRYGWNGDCPISVLTNFEHLAIYECLERPSQTDEASSHRLRIYRYDELVAHFDEIYDRLSQESVVTGRFDEIYEAATLDFKGQSFDDLFLEQIETWRQRIASDLHARNAGLSADELNFLVQRLINRIVFLRICEDREGITRDADDALFRVTTYDGLKERFRKADQRYNSGLFDFIEDTLSMRVDIGADVLIAIFRELYFPNSPYDFTVVESSVLGEIYEQFLARELIVGAAGVELEPKPEVAASDGVVSTPRGVVDRIVDKALGPLVEGRTPAEISSVTVADIACGSGVFLLSAYEYLLGHCLEWYVADGFQNHPERVYDAGANSFRLTITERKRILLESIYGVDLDAQAVEVAKFSLLLKVLEDQTAAAIDEELRVGRRKALPHLDSNLKIGNSLVGSDYHDFEPSLADSAEQLVKVNPFDWETEFPAVFERGGFSCIVGNPPYIRIQNMVLYSPREVQFYQSDLSPYKTARHDNFDKYALFVERALTLAGTGGRVGFIVPNKFMAIKSGKALRALLSEGRHVSSVVHFGVLQLFRGRATYTCIVVLTKNANETFKVEHVQSLGAWLGGRSLTVEERDADSIDESPWIFVTPEVRTLFEKTRTARPTVPLKSVAPPFVGLQTSDDDVYAIRGGDEDDQYVYKTDRIKEGKKVRLGKRWPIERGILREFLWDQKKLENFSHTESNAYLIFPYVISEGKPVLIDAETMERDFPKCWEYLNSHKDRLAKRSVQGVTAETWYRYGRSQSLRKFDERVRLIWPVLSLEPRYTVDLGGATITGGGNGPYYALRCESDELSEYYILACLSHPVLELMVRASASKFGGGYYSHGKQFLDQLPIRRFDLSNAPEKAQYDGIVNASKDLVSTTERWRKQTIPAQRIALERLVQVRRKQLMSLVTAAYGLDAADLAVISSADLNPEGIDE